MSDTYVVMPIVVHEFVDCPVPEEELELPQELEQRCCLFRQRVPPDQLNSRVGVGIPCNTPTLHPVTEQEQPRPALLRVNDFHLECLCQGR